MMQFLFVCFLSLILAAPSLASAGLTKRPGGGSNLRGTFGPKQLASLQLREDGTARNLLPSDENNSMVVLAEFLNVFANSLVEWKGQDNCNKIESPCVGTNRVFCDETGEKIFICHHYEDGTFGAFCIDEASATDHLLNNGDDRCGHCEDSVVRVLDTVLDMVDTPEEALELIDPVDLEIMIQSVRATVSDDFKEMITTEAVLAAFFPNPNVTFELPEISEDASSELSDEPLDDDNDEDYRRLLAIASSTSRNRRLFLDELFEDYPEGCKEDTITFFISTLSLGFAAVGVVGATSVASKVTTDVVLASEPMVLRTLTLIGKSWKTRTSAAQLIALKEGGSLFIKIADFYGVKAMWRAMKKAMTWQQIAVSGASIIVSMVALIATNGASVWVQVLILAVAIAQWALDLNSWIDTCNVDYCLTSRRLDEIECDDGDLCTLDASYCDSSTNYTWQCTYSPMTCQAGTSCDPADGLCKADDELVPCVAVIDEDDSFSTGGESSQVVMWDLFRIHYPSRPFCLLVPEPVTSQYGNVTVPPKFLNDSLTFLHYNVARDDGDPTKREDWVSLCGLAPYSQSTVRWVGLFIDDSGSMKESQVAASRDKFYQDIQAKGIQVKKVVNTKKNWILPFMTALAPTPLT